jgi:hypothetical protein
LIIVLTSIIREIQENTKRKDRNIRKLIRISKGRMGVEATKNIEKQLKWSPLVRSS